MTLRHTIFAVSLLAGPAYASTLTFNVTLSSTNEVPPTSSPATGTATIVLNTVAQTLNVDITYSNLTTSATGAHIHCCTPSPTTMNVGVATTVPAFPGFPLGTTSGTYLGTLDLTSSASYNPAFVTLEGGVPQAEAALIAGLESNQTYLNIHTSQNPGGEIRAALLTPEPATLLLSAAALAGLMIRRRGRTVGTR
jgi:hypothetical protein